MITYKQTKTCKIICFHYLSLWPDVNNIFLFLSPTPKIKKLAGVFSALQITITVNVSLGKITRNIGRKLDVMLSRHDSQMILEFHNIQR